MANARKRISLPKPKEPRTRDLIEQDYGRLVSQAGQCSYQVYVYTKDLERLNQEIESLNFEAANRKELDDKKKEQESKNDSQG